MRSVLVGALALSCILPMVSSVGSAGATLAAPAPVAVVASSGARTCTGPAERGQLVDTASSSRDHHGEGRSADADVDGVDVTPLLRAGTNGTYTAELSLRHGLHQGINDVFAHVKGDTSGTYDHQRFIVAKRTTALLTIASVEMNTADAPVRVTINRATQARMLRLPQRPAHRRRVRR